MMIVRIKTVVDIKTQENVRERIKEQISEGLIVHDDTIEILFVEDSECHIDNATLMIDGESFKAETIKDALTPLRTCMNCGYQRNLPK